MISLIDINETTKKSIRIRQSKNTTLQLLKTNVKQLMLTMLTSTSPWMFRSQHDLEK
eukprot:m.72246 g.72246  ORF g.72246 m.72246 type:complete len:57 (+) comp24439_c0_seq1:365-535(+)